MSAWVHETSFPIPAPGDRIYQALVDESELRRWFAEFAEVEPRVGGAYRFWGRYTVGTPGPEQARGSVRSLDPDRILAYEWRFFDVPSRVTFTLTPEDADGAGAGTRVAITHALEGPIDRPRPAELVDDWWRFVLGNLTSHVTGRGSVMRPDFGDERPEVRLSTVIDAPPAAVFRALVEPALLNRWIAQDARVEPRVGGAFDLGWRQAEGVEHEGAAMRIVEFEPNVRLAITWPDWRGDPAVPDQRVRWTLAPEGAGTRVTLVHSGFVRAVDISDYPFGWGHFLDQMAEVAVDLPPVDALGGATPA